MGIHNLFLLVMIFTIHSLLMPCTTSTSFENTTFNFTSFNPNMHEIRYEGNASVAGQAILLTSNQQDSSPNENVGRATYKDPIHLWDKENLADFTTHFSLIIKWGNNTFKGDGLSFFLAPSGSQMPPNSMGGNLGLLSSSQVSSSATSSFVAVEFDTFHNINWDPEREDDHVGIDINSLRSNETVCLYGSPTAESERVSVDAWINYDSRSKNFSVLFISNYNISSRSYSASLSLIVDLRHYLPEWVTFGFSGATGGYFEIHKICSWDFSCSLQVAENVTTNQTSNPAAAPMPKRRISRGWPWGPLGIGGGMLVLVSFILVLVWFLCWRKRKTRGERENTAPMDEDIEMVTVPRKFLYSNLVVATNNFADEGLLGEGGFGRVYLGFLKDMNSNVAVKRITPQSQQGMREYVSEVKTISQLRHRNLVQLIGWCHEKQEFLIVYQFMPNKSLDFHLFKEPCLLTWEKRYTIALGLASALSYLQEECEQCVLHRDIKSSNVLLDLNFSAKLGDFGLARLVDHGQESQTTILLATEGYISPEYLVTSKATKESDVYSFGIVALEIACGKKAIGEVDRNGKKVKIKLVEWVWEQYRKGEIFDAADPRLCQNYNVEQMERLIVVGLACAHPNQYDRPSIRQAVDIMNFKAPLPLLPLEIPVLTYVASRGAADLERGQQPYSGSTTPTTNSAKVTTRYTDSDTSN